MVTNYEDSLTCMVNFKATRAWRREAHALAERRGLNLSEYLKHLVEQDRNRNPDA
jgi:hypothetical protein